MTTNFHTLAVSVQGIRTSKSRIEHMVLRCFLPLCNSITHQAIALDSCSNAQKMVTNFKDSLQIAIINEFSVCDC